MQVSVGAGSAIRGTHVQVGTEVLRQSGIALFTGRLSRVQRHFGTFNHNVMDLKSLPSVDKKKERKYEIRKQTKLQKGGWKNYSKEGKEGKEGGKEITTRKQSKEIAGGKE